MRGICRLAVRLAGLLAALACLSAPPSHADELGSELKRFLHDDAQAVLHFRSYFLDRTNPAPPNNAAWAGGGWVGLKTGWLYDTFQLAAVGYTTQPLWAPLATDGTQLLAPRAARLLDAGRDERFDPGEGPSVHRLSPAARRA
jgi:hypothetical protein